MLIFGKYASWMLFFQKILTNPTISEISFLLRHHFSTLFVNGYDNKYMYDKAGKFIRLCHCWSTMLFLNF